jgi:hypothetical protein
MLAGDQVVLDHQVHANAADGDLRLPNEENLPFDGPFIATRATFLPSGSLALISRMVVTPLC